MGYNGGYQASWTPRSKAAKRAKAEQSARASKRARQHAKDPDVKVYREEAEKSKARTEAAYAKMMADAEAAWQRQQAQDEIRTKGGRRRRQFNVESRDPLEIKLREFRRTA